MNLARSFTLAILLALIALFLVLYFFFPHVLSQLTRYGGAGSPFVQPP